MTPLITILAIGGYVLGGVLMYGACLAYWQKTYCKTNSQYFEKDRTHAVTIAILWPAAIPLAIFIYNNGFMFVWRNPHLDNSKEGMW